MIHKPKVDIKALNQKSYTLPLQHHAWLGQKLTARKG